MRLSICVCVNQTYHLPVIMDLDLDGFGVPTGAVDDRSEAATGFEDAQSALRHINTWYRERNRRGRQMDLIGDYAGTEPFVLDGKPSFFIIRDLKSTEYHGCRGGYTTGDFG
jgi:hypothetical protein